MIELILGPISFLAGLFIAESTKEEIEKKFNHTFIIMITSFIITGLFAVQSIGFYSTYFYIIIVLIILSIIPFFYNLISGIIFTYSVLIISYLITPKESQIIIVALMIPYAISSGIVFKNNSYQKKKI